MPHRPGLGHAVRGHEIRDVRQAGHPGTSARVSLPEPVEVNDLGRANRAFEVERGTEQVDARRRDRTFEPGGGRGWTMVIGSPMRASEPVIPRMLGTIPPSRLGSSPLQQCSQRAATRSGGFRTAGPSPGQVRS